MFIDTKTFSRPRLLRSAIELLADFQQSCITFNCANIGPLLFYYYCTVLFRLIHRTHVLDENTVGTYFTLLLLCG